MLSNSVSPLIIIDPDTAVENLFDAIENDQKYAHHFKTLATVVELQGGQNLIDSLSENYRQDEASPFTWDRKNEAGETYLTLGVKMRNETFVEDLLQKTKFVDSPNDASQTPLDIAAIDNQDEAMIRMLLEGGAKQFKRDEFYKTLSVLDRDTRNSLIKVFEDYKINLMDEGGAEILMDNAIINNNLPLIIDLHQKLPSYDLVPFMAKKDKLNWTEDKNWYDLLLTQQKKIDPLILLFAEKNQFAIFNAQCKIQENDGELTFEFRKPMPKHLYNIMFGENRDEDSDDIIYDHYKKSTDNFLKFY